MPKRVTMKAGHDEARALAGRDPDADPLADEIIAETGDACIGDDAAVFDLRIDELDRAELGAALAEVFAVDPDRIAGLEEARMALRHAQAQHEILLGDGRDRFAANTTVPAVTGTVSTRPAVGASTLPSVSCCSITERSACAPSAHWWRRHRRSAPHRAVAFAVVPCANSSSARSRSVWAWASCASRPEICASSDFTAAPASRRRPSPPPGPARRDRPLHRKLHHGAADPRTRRRDIDALDGGEHGLLVGDRRRRYDKGFLSERGWANSASAAATTIPARIGPFLQSSVHRVTARVARSGGDH